MSKVIRGCFRHFGSLTRIWGRPGQNYRVAEAKGDSEGQAEPPNALGLAHPALSTSLKCTMNTGLLVKAHNSIFLIMGRCIPQCCC